MKHNYSNGQDSIEPSFVFLFIDYSSKTEHSLSEHKIQMLVPQLEQNIKK
jgi:hypothetical protein